jgi:imidazolonepropionase-like amidohydrolase
MARRIAVLVGLILCCVSLNAQAPKQAVKKRLAVRAGRLIDGKSDQLITNAMVVVEDGKIVSVTSGGTAPAGVEVIDLSHATVLSGFTDAHTHVLLQGDVTAADYDEQLLKQ